MVTRTVTVNVTAEDIASGKSEDRYRCPVSLATARALGVEKVFIWTHSWWLKKNIFGPLPEVATAFIRAFDHKRPVQPFSFEIEVPA